MRLSFFAGFRAQNFRHLFCPLCRYGSQVEVVGDSTQSGCILFNIVQLCDLRGGVASRSATWRGVRDFKRDVANMLNEEVIVRPIRERLHQKQKHQTQQRQNGKKNRDSWER